MMNTVVLFIRGASCNPPECNGKRYSSPAKLDPKTKITCERCGRRREIGDALRASMQAAKRKKLRPKTIL